MDELLTEILVLIGNGNPGGLRVAMEIIQVPDDGWKLLWLCSLDNIKGWKLWIAYKEIANGELEILIDLIRTRKLLNLLIENESYKSHMEHEKNKA